MKNIQDLTIGFGDAENYQKKENKELFNKIFVKNRFLDFLLQPNVYFLIGEKGTGKTAYAVFLSNNEFKNTKSILKYIRETDYDKFLILKKEKQLNLSEYTQIWKVIILLILVKSINSKDLDHNIFQKYEKLDSINKAIDEYYNNAFSPEILYALNFIENSQIAAELISKYVTLSGDKSQSISFHETRFQTNLLYLQNQFESILSKLKLKMNHVLFIDGIDIRPGTIPFHDYLECIKGLANALWSLNNDFFGNIKDSKGRFRVVLLSRPDIFNSLGLQNSTNKLNDNSVVLDWKTTYPIYRKSDLFKIADQLLSSQQNTSLDFGETWDFYFPWKTKTTSPERDFDEPFMHFLKISYSRPRDIVTMIKFLKENFDNENKEKSKTFSQADLIDYKFLNSHSQYLMGGIKDQLAFYYTEKDYEVFLVFFNYLNGYSQFDYDEYLIAYKKFTEYVLNTHDDIPQFIDDKPEIFLQFLYDSNIICYIDESEYGEPFFRWCYRERSQSNISPKVKPYSRYHVHYGLQKALNLGNKRFK